MHSNPSVALAAVPPATVSPVHLADDLAAAFLAGYGPSTREAYGRDLRSWGHYLAGLGVLMRTARKVRHAAQMQRSEKVLEIR